MRWSEAKKRWPELFNFGYDTSGTARQPLSAIVERMGYPWIRVDLDEMAALSAEKRLRVEAGGGGSFKWGDW